MHTLWEADVEVFKAHITTSPAGEVLDMFWLYDNRQQLPDHHRRALPPGCNEQCIAVACVAKRLRRFDTRHLHPPQIGARHERRVLCSGSRM
jgi:hypothetical protein